MSGNTPDFYAILGISQNADKEEIERKHKELIKECHPDPYNGLKAKYEDSGDEELLKIIEEKIRQAEEESKLINEAYEVLSDPTKREEYDRTYQSAVATPEIVINPTKLDFGLVTEGDAESATFTIENRGGPVETIHVDWESDPTWGELIIRPDPDEVFPIEVTVVVDSSGASPGPKEAKVVIAVGDQVQVVEVGVTIVELQPTVTPGPVAPVPGPVTKWKRLLLRFGLPLAFVFLLCGFPLIWLASQASPNGSDAPELRGQEVIAQEQLRDQQYQQQVELLSRNLSSAFTITTKRVPQNRTGESFAERIDIEFTVTNKSKTRVRIFIEAEGVLTCYFASDLLEPSESKTYRCEDLTVQFKDNSNRSEGLVVTSNYSRPAQELCLKVILADGSGTELGSTCEDIPQEVYFPLASQEESIHNLIQMRDVALLTGSQIDPEGCENPVWWEWPSSEWCSGIQEMRFTVVNGWTEPVILLLGGLETLEPGQKMSFQKGFDEETKNCFTVETEGLASWKMCPLDYVN
jgi:hypothetical protein